MHVMRTTTHHSCNVAAGSGKAEVAMCLIREFGSDPNVRVKLVDLYYIMHVKEAVSV